MIRRPPRSTLSSSSAASDVYKRQIVHQVRLFLFHRLQDQTLVESSGPLLHSCFQWAFRKYYIESVSYTHLRAHETRHDLVCRLLLEKKKKKKKKHKHNYND